MTRLALIHSVILSLALLLLAGCSEESLLMPADTVPAPAEVPSATDQSRHAADESARSTNTASNGNSRPVPFRVTYTIVPELLLPGDVGYPARCPTGPTDVAARASGEGQGTHLGSFTETETNCIDVATLTLSLGEFTLTAANGDRVWGTFEGSASTDPPPPNAILSCTWTIDGGTGRFVGASGAGDCVDSYQLGDGRSVIGFDGWIRYDASQRSAR